MTGALWLLLAGHAAAGPLHDRVMTMLNAYETPVTAAAVEALGEGATAELLAIANDTEVPPTRRARALTALQHVPVTEAVSTAFREHLKGAESLLRRHAALSMAVLGDAAVDDLAATARHDDVELRIAAVQSLGRIGTAKANVALASYRSTEREARVKKALDEVGVRR